MRPSLYVALLLSLAGCGDDTSALPTADLSVPPDLAPPIDLAPYPDLVPSLGVGMPCPNGNECMAGLTCFGSRLDPNLPPEGYCTKGCNNDPDCGAGAFCGPPLDKAGNLCWLRCGANDSCANPKQVCGRRLGGFTDLVNKACLPGNAAAKDGGPCKTFGDCNRNQACINNPFDFPGGYCTTIGCTVGDDSTCAPGGMPGCFPGDNNTSLCLPTCAADADCRLNEGYKCTQVPNSTKKVCVVNNPLGGNCKAPADCNGGAPWTCINNMNLPNGYCSIVGCDVKNDAGCPTNGHCVNVMQNVNVCFRKCNVDGECAAGTTCKMAPAAPGLVKVCLP